MKTPQLILRIVKMQFQANKVADFLKMFEKNKTQIRAFKGCQHLELLNDQADSTIFFTISHWENSEALEQYRTSDFFRTVWPKVKPLFKAKPEAWTTTQTFIAR